MLLFLLLSLSLSLSRGRFGNVEAFQKLISACSSLEELIIDQFEGEFWEFHILSSLTLKRLKVLVSNSRMSERVSFDLPNLLYLEYTDCVHRQYPVVNLDSLVEAKLNIAMTEPDDCDISNLIKGLGNVKILHLLTPATVQIFGTFNEAMHVFKNLFQLSVSLHACSPGSYVLCLDSLLKKSPQLHTLIIEGPLCLIDYECDCKCFLECTHLSSSPVKVIELTVYEGSIKELEQMKHLLEELSCLELVKVRAFANDDEEKLRITTDLQTLPRASSKCEIQVEFS